VEEGKKERKEKQRRRNLECQLGSLLKVFQQIFESHNVQLTVVDQHQSATQDLKKGEKAKKEIINKKKRKRGGANT
jgi:hypothetical protein